MAELKINMQHSSSMAETGRIFFIVEFERIVTQQAACKRHLRQINRQGLV